MIKWIPLSTWSSWTPQERSEVVQYYENIGQKWALDLNNAKPQHDRLGEFDKDKEEYLEDMSLGGQSYKERR